MLSENVIELGKESDLYQDILAFINEQRSDNTKESYLVDIKQFFILCPIIQKELPFITIKDLKKIKKRDLINYRTFLKNKYNISNKTINRKITSIKMLYHFLSTDYELNTDIFNFKRLPEEHNPYGELSQTEAERFAEVAFQTEREKPYLKKMLILFAIRTSFRINEILNIRWSDFEEFEYGYKVTTKVGKGNKVNTNAITKNLYNQIEQLKEINKNTKWNGDPEIVFQITYKSVSEMMHRLLKKLNIPKERNIVFHSFRGVAIDWELEQTGDIRLAAQQGNHSNINTTYKHYIKKTKDYSQVAGIRMEEEIDLSFMDELTIDDFKKFIKNGDYKLKMCFKKYFENVIATKSN
ncbi:site-specific integrase [Caldifermentibacillus hisashii]|uniref:Site-specific integrase n=1 Tax=Caldifermentibacillus hisashii TaxID=996558 RepID=A0ABU9K2Z3_9BACI